MWLLIAVGVALTSSIRLSWTRFQHLSGAKDHSTLTITKVLSRYGKNWSVCGAGQWFFRTNRPTPALAPSLHSLQVLSAAKAVCADACVGCAVPMTFMLPPAAGWALTT